MHKCMLIPKIQRITYSTSDVFYVFSLIAHSDFLAFVLNLAISSEIQTDKFF